MQGNSLKRRAVLGGAAMLASTPMFGAAGASGGPVRIGVLTDESGPYSDSGGTGSVVAARMAVQDFGGVVLGRKIEIQHSDTQNKPDAASSIARAGVRCRRGRDHRPAGHTRSRGGAADRAREEPHRYDHRRGRQRVHVAELLAGQQSLGGRHACDGNWHRQSADQSGRPDVVLHHCQYQLRRGAAGRGDQGHRGQRRKSRGQHEVPHRQSRFSSQIVEAQSSGATVIGLASVGGDQVNLIKQTAEFGLQKGGAQLAGFLVYITDIHALGLAAAQGLSFPASFYWDQSDEFRAFAKRFMTERKAMPTQNQASVYAGVLHFLKAMAQAGTDDAIGVNKAMRTAPVAFFGSPATMRADGRVLDHVTLYRVKRPDESRVPWDYYTAVGTIPASEAFLPLNRKRWAATLLPSPARK